MPALTSGVVCSNRDARGKQMLDTQVPLIDLSVARLSCAEGVAVVKTPHRQLSILIPLRLRKSTRKWIRECGQPAFEVVLRKSNWVRIAKSWAWALVIGCNV